MIPAVVAQTTLVGFDKFLNALINGVALGAVYALLALGFVIIFKATQVVNFAHGSLAAVGAFLTAALATIYQFPGRLIPEAPAWLRWSLSAIFAVAAAAVVGLIVERLFIRPMVGEPLFSVAIITIGADIVIRTINDDFVGQGARSLGDPWGLSVVVWGNQRINQTQLVTIGVAVLCFLLIAWFFRSRLGVAMRATAFDQEAAQAQGINVGRIFAVAWAIGAALAAVAGIFSSVLPRAAGVSNTTAFVVFRAFPAVIIGGLDSVIGAVVAGFLVGIAEFVIGTYSAGYSSVLGVGFGSVVPYLLMLIFLLFRPYGLFGTEEIRRV
ncbi:MAG TPA: branched-chain amino acid ABC transporter permease [Acidimicrobiia bacterium]|nr:branched-chain amino acid ABC transporter permease [Acidimicrobiia bacterium]